MTPWQRLTGAGSAAAVVLTLHTAINLLVLRRPEAWLTLTVPLPAMTPTWVTSPASTASTSCPCVAARSMPR